MKRKILITIAISILLALSLMTYKALNKPSEEFISLFDTKTYSVELKGSDTRITDKTADEVINFEKKKLLVPKDLQQSQWQDLCKAKIVYDSEALRLETVKSLIIITDKSTGEIVYV